MTPPDTAFSASSSSWSEKKTPRQRPGLACEGCRRRKLRCDGQQPQCSACLEADSICIPTSATSQRGPRKGHMKALQMRLNKLEQQLLEQQNQNGPLQTEQSMDLELELNPSSESLLPLRLPTPPPSADPTPKDILFENYLLSPSTNVFISDLQRADLDQLYFERAHPFAPIMHQQRYFSWSREETKTKSQMQHIRISLYDYTQRLLESLEVDDDSKCDFNDIEHIQARLLLLIYDFMQTSHQRGWMSSGRCFRLLQLMRLYEIDLPENVLKRNSDSEAENWIGIEEKRRTFWMAYSLDRFICLRDESPLMLNEHTICTRLPCPEEDFRAGHGVEMGFLSEAMIAVDQTRLSPFTEVVILATICGRAITHQQQSKVEHVYSNVPQHFWDRHQWLDEMLRTRAEILTLAYPATAQHVDCMLLFANMVAQTTILYLCKVMESVKLEADQYQNAIAAFKQRSLLAAKEIVKLSRSLPVISYFKVHPFTPYSLIICADFFSSHRYLDESVETQIQETYGVLRGMGSVNSLAQDYFMS